MSWKLLTIQTDVAYETDGYCLQNEWKLLIKQMGVAYVFGDIMKNKPDKLNKPIDF